MSNKLHNTFEETQNDLIKASRNFDWANKDNYISWLACTLDYANNSTRLLALAAGCFEDDKIKFSDRFIAHAAEEKGHDKLLKNDLKFFNLKPSDIKPTYEMQCYSKSLYYWTSPAGNPIGLLGWILSLEGIAASVGPEVFEKVKSIHGPQSASFLKVHADADPDHLEKALKISDFLTEEETDLVCETMKMYTHQYIMILNSIENKFQKRIAA